MPKSTGPLSEQLGFTSTQAPSTNNNMTDSTTNAADKLGANKSTNAIPQEVRSPKCSTVLFTSSFIPLHFLYIFLLTYFPEPQHHLLRRRHWKAIQP
jgi:hypothetical protein